MQISTYTYFSTAFTKYFTPTMEHNNSHVTPIASLPVLAASSEQSSSQDPTTPVSVKYVCS